MTILHLDSGLFVDQSVSRKLSKQIVARVKRDDDTVVYRDLVTNAVPHLDAETLLAEENPLTEELLA